MAYSTQKEFFNVPFLNKPMENCDCSDDGLTMKDYATATDRRSWGRDPAQQSRYYTELVTCNLTNSRGQCHSRNRGETNESSDNAGKGEDCSAEKRDLQHKLKVATDCFRKVNEENNMFKRIIKQQYDDNPSDEFYRKIKHLQMSCKITKCDEVELFDVYQKGLCKAQAELEKENCALKDLLDKLSRRAAMECIKAEPETSCDIPYLQNMVNSLRKEVILLSGVQQKKMNRQCANNDNENMNKILEECNTLRDKCGLIKGLENQVSALRGIAKDGEDKCKTLKNTLDNQCRYIKEIEQEMHTMQIYYDEQMQHAKANENVLKRQLQDLKEQFIHAKVRNKHLDNLEMEINNLHSEVRRRDMALSDYDCQYKQLMCVVSDLQKTRVKGLQDTACQTCSCQIDDELSFYASATLKEIAKELGRRSNTLLTTSIQSKEALLKRAKLQGSWDDFGVSNNLKTKSPIADTNIIDQIHRLQSTVIQLRAEKLKLEQSSQKMQTLQVSIEQLQSDKSYLEEALASNKKGNLEYANLLAEANRKLEELQTQHDKLNKETITSAAENQRLKRKLIGLSDKLSDIDNKMNNHLKETSEVTKDIQASIRLAKEISEVQIKNQELVSAVNAINIKDDQKIIDELRKQLFEEQEQLKRCKENAAIQVADLRKKLQEQQEKCKLLQSNNENGSPQSGKGISGVYAALRNANTLDGTTNTVGKEISSLQLNNENVFARSGKGTTDSYTALRNTIADSPDELRRQLLDEREKRKRLQLENDNLRQELKNRNLELNQTLEAARYLKAQVIDQNRRHQNNENNYDIFKSGKRTNDGTSRYESDRAKSHVQKQSANDKNASIKSAVDSKRLSDKARSQVTDTTAGKNLTNRNEAKSAVDSKWLSDRANSQVRDTAAGKNLTNRNEAKSAVDSKRANDKAHSQATDAAAGKNLTNRSEGKSDANKQRKSNTSVDLSRGSDTVSKFVDFTEKRKSGENETVGASASRPLKRSLSLRQSQYNFDFNPKSEYRLGGGDNWIKLTVDANGSTRRLTYANRIGNTSNNAYNNFICRSASSLEQNIKDGQNLENALHTILDELIEECGFCYCKNNKPRNKFYAICHKMLHSGIQAVAFKELAYFHRKMYLTAEKLYPGCLLKMFLAEQEGETDGEFDSETEKCEAGGDLLKCCNCKSVLCCNDSEQFLKDKVFKLETEIKIAKASLNKFMIRSQSARRKTYRICDENCKPIEKSISKSNTRQVKRLKVRI